MALASANLHTGRYEGMCPQFNLAFSSEEAATFGRGLFTFRKTWPVEIMEVPTPSGLLTINYLNIASVEFAEDTRQQVRSCSTLPQALDNAVDLVKSTLPKGKQS